MGSPLLQAPSVSTSPGPSNSVPSPVFDQPLLALIRQSGTPARLIAAYVFLLPFVAGLPRGRVLPILRVSELIQFAITGLALLMAAVAYARGHRWRFQFHLVDWAMIALAFFGSVVPVVSLLARGESFALSSVVEAMALTKYLGLWILARIALRTVADVAAVLVAAITAVSAVALLAIFEGLGIGPTGAITRSLVGSESTVGVEGRVFTLLGSAISTGAVIAIVSGAAFSLAITRRQPLLLAFGGLFLVGSVATGQMTSLLAMMVVLGVTALHHRVFVRSVLLGLPALAAGLAVTYPVIERRLADTSGRSLVPQSWVIRWTNVSELYWPDIADGGWVLGVQPGTVLVPPDTWRNEVFLESGYLWTLWVGGLPLLACFLWFLVAGWRSLSVTSTSAVHESARVAARGALVFMALFNVIDPHLTLRGGADLTYVLLPAALAYLPMTVASRQRHRVLGLLGNSDDPARMAEARLQLGEIGGPLLAGSGWGAVEPGNGVDRGIDLAVAYRGSHIAEARIYFETDGARLRGFMFHPVHAQDADAEALIWRSIGLCADSLGLETLTLAPTLTGVERLSRTEIRALAREATILERARHGHQTLIRELHQGSGVRQFAQTPPSIRLVPSQGISRMRRSIDIILAGGALVCFAPFAAVIALLIRRSSPGTVFFRQMRLGAGGQPFRILKYRTMDNSAGPDVHRTSIEQSLATGEADAKISLDPRITRVGQFLRQTSLDEVPQLINVLRGEMTLVGPRPSLLWETSLFRPQTRLRLTMVPGIAGLWQSSGRGDLSTEEMLELDMEYASSVSGSNDVRLMAKTVAAVIKKDGAR